MRGLMAKSKQYRWVTSLLTDDDLKQLVSDVVDAANTKGNKQGNRDKAQEMCNILGIGHL